MYKGGKNHPRMTCSFCGKPAEQVEKIITGAGVNICNECVTMCHRMLVDELAKDVAAQPKETAVKQKPLPPPSKIKAHLDEYVIGQDAAKTALSVAVYNHYKRLRYKKSHQEQGDVEVDKSNLLLVGPTGSGKTLLAQTMARFLDVPFTIVDATILTEAGYVGEDVESILVRLLQAADYDVARAEQGIVFVDEIDKIARKTANPSITRDVSGEGVQQGLLKILEGTVAAVPPKGGRKHPEQNLVHINTRNILFICGGAFETLDKVIARRVSQSGMGFGADVRSEREHELGALFRQLEPDDLIHFGLIPELVGRLPVAVALDELDEFALYNILTKPKNSMVKQFKKLFEMDGIELSFTEEALQEVVRKTIERKTGARGLRSVLEKSLQQLMYELPGSGVKKLEVTSEMISEALSAAPAKKTSSNLPDKKKVA